MSMSLDPSAGGNARNALFLARACELAYLAEAVGIPRFRSELGLEARLISVDNTQVYVAENDQAIVVAFRGSERLTTLDGLKDWLLTNANNYLILPEGQSGTEFAAAGVVRGFIEAFWMHLPWSGSRFLRPWISAEDQGTAALGHRSQSGWGDRAAGGVAVSAQFLAVQEIITFGAPMIGNDTAAKAFEQEFSGRFIATSTWKTWCRICLR